MSYLQNKLKQMTLTNKVLLATIGGWFVLSAAVLIYIRVAYADELLAIFG